MPGSFDVGPGARADREPGLEPTVLLVGADTSFHGAIASALAHHGVRVETASPNGVVDGVIATAPDLVLLVGDATNDGGSSALAQLNASPHSSVVPVVLLADEVALDQRLRAFRHGAAAVIPRSASVDAIADRVGKLAREIPDRGGGTMGYVGEATLDELVQAFSKELRSGILSVKSSRGAEHDAIRVVLGGGRPLAQTIDEFVSRLRKHVVHAEPLEYEFDERAGGTVQLLGTDALDQFAGAGDVSGLRILLADEDAARSDSIAQALRAHGATVVVTDFEPPEPRFARLRQLDPTILLIDEEGLRGRGYQLVRRLRRDTRLRWASLLVVRWDEIWSDTEGAARLSRTLGTLAALSEPERALRERVELGATFDTRLEITGPARLVRALATSSHPVRATVHNPRVQIRLEVSDHLIAGARATAEDSSALDGAVALSALLVLGSGRVHIERIVEPDAVNIMSPVDVALDLADSEAAPIQPSMPVLESIHPDAFASAPPDARSSRRALAIWSLIGVGSIICGIAIAVGVVSFGKARAPALEPPAAVAAPHALPVAPVAPTSRAHQTRALAGSGAAPPTGAAAAATESPDATGERIVSTPTCEQRVGPSWSLLGSDQPGRALVEVGLGRRALMLGKLDDAQLSFCRAAVLDPTRPEAFQALVRILLLRRDANQARDWAERAAKQHPESQEIQSLYADALARAGDVDRARTIWLEGAHIDPSDAASVRGMGYTYIHGAERAVKGADYAQADRLYRRAVLLDPVNATAAAGLARVLLVEAEIPAALNWAKRAVRLDPHDPELHVLLGDVEDKAGDLDAARIEWKTAYDIDPHDFKAASRMLRAK